MVSGSYGGGSGIDGGHWNPTVVHLGAGTSMASGSSSGGSGIGGGQWNPMGEGLRLGGHPSVGGGSSGAGSSRGGSGGSASRTGEAECRVWLDPRPDAAFMHVEDMELMLWRACAFFGIGAPIFLPQAARETSKGVGFGFIVLLPHNDRGLDFVAYRPVVGDERVARQEAAFGMLEKILVAMDHTICDFNHRMIGRFRQSYNHEREEEVESMQRRIRELEALNEDPKKQIEMIEEMLDGE
ncbi:hypothetical protein PIB30_059027 [Stylosanthes scabra]|uniref:Uncharacterized protein n=1 Tax=Stylosanthes scabra TaxID=79078 RepID=A0ABU6SKI9_9FABA|nr:hypothetical protein [Stylosanthes scabra]